MDRSFFMNSSLVVHRVYFIITGEDRLMRDGSPCYHSPFEFIDPILSSSPARDCPACPLTSSVRQIKSSSVFELSKRSL